MATNTIQTLLDDIRPLDGEQYALVQLVRELVMKLIPSASESVKYGGILFSVDAHFCGVFAYKKHVSLELSYGAGIDDVYGHLEGNGKSRRHLKLFSVDDIASKELAYYIPAALQEMRQQS